MGSKFSDIALCLSSNDNLMWSARRKYWLGFVMAALGSVISGAKVAIDSYLDLREASYRELDNIFGRIVGRSVIITTYMVASLAQAPTHYVLW